MTNQLQDLEVERLIPSPMNPRKTFDQLKLEELARSIREKGVLEPLLVRPDPAYTNGVAMYEVIAGERRYRASKLAGVETVPCIVRELDDVEVLEIMVIENLQRDDLHPMEEAQGYADLIKRAGYDVARIAESVGKSEKYVYDRVKLLQLVPELREVFLAGEITAGHAILLARLSAADQKRVLGKGDGYGAGLFQVEHFNPSPSLELDDAERVRPRRKAVSVRELDTWIADNVRFRPEAEDLPNLFPETEAALAAAAEEELKVIHITRSHQLRVEARGEGRTYSRPSWKRADGGLDTDGYGSPKPSKPCEHRVMGVVVAGPGRGEAFYVCIAKKKCDVHWGKERKAAEKRKAGAGSRAAQQESWREQERRQQEQWKREDAERARWKKAAPKLLEALAEKLEATPALKLVDIVLEACQPRWGRPADLKAMERGETLDPISREELGRGGRDLPRDRDVSDLSERAAHAGSDS